MSGRSALALGVILGSNLFLWWGVSPTGAEPPSFLGARGPREVWVLCFLVLLFAASLWRSSPPASLLLVWATFSAGYSILFMGRPFVLVFYDLTYLAALAGWFCYGPKVGLRFSAFLIVGLGLFNAIWAGIQLGGWDPIWISIRPSEIPWNQRPTGWLDNNANLAHFLAMAIPLAIPIFPWMIPLLMVPVVLAAKTLPILAMCLGVIVAKRWVFPGLAMFALASIFIGRYDPPSFTGDGVRLSVLRDSIKLGSRSPILGMGPGSFKEEFPKWLLTHEHGFGDIAVRDPETNIHNLQQKLPTHTEVFYHPSNELLKGVFELGWPILAIVLWAAVSLAVRAAKMPKDKWRDGFAGASVAFAVTAIGYQPFAVPALAITGLLVWGILNSSLRKKTYASPPS